MTVFTVVSDPTGRGRTEEAHGKEKDPNRRR
jgi:hypothetical protein